MPDQPDNPQSAPLMPEGQAGAQHIPLPDQPGAPSPAPASSATQTGAENSPTQPGAPSPAPASFETQADTKHQPSQPGNPPSALPSMPGREHIVWVIRALFVILVVVIAVLADVHQMFPVLTRWWQERFPPIPPARAGETLIVIAPYQSPEGVDRSTIHKEIMRTLHAEHEALQREVNAPTLNVRIAEAPQALNGEDCSAARALGQQVGAALVVWGEVSDVRVTTNILNLRQPEEVIINLSETERTPLANPQAFTRYVTSDLPGIAVYISFSIMGDAYYSAEEYPTATRLLERAVARLPEDAPLADVAQTFLRLGWLYHVSENNLTQTIAAYDRALELDPKNAIACYNRGLARRAQGDLTQAIADYTCAIELNSKYVSAYLSRGGARRAQGDLAGALADYKHALKLDPRNANAYIGQGLTYYDQGNLTQAIYDYTAAISFDPKNAIAYNNRGIVRYDQGDLAGAITDYDQAIKLDPNDVDAYVGRGLARYKQGDLAGAIADYDQAIKLNPNDVDAYVGRGLARYKQGDLAGAIADYDRAIELDPNYVNAYMNRGAARRDQGDRQGALADFERARALTRDPQDQKWLDEQIAALR